MDRLSRFESIRGPGNHGRPLLTDGRFMRMLRKTARACPEPSEAPAKRRNKMPEAAKQRHKPPVRRADYWTSVLVLVFVSVFFITVAAACYGIIVTPPASPGVIPTLAFPWIGWLAAVLTATAVILGFAQYIARKNPEPRSGETAANGTTPDAAEEAWSEQLPKQALRIYRIIRDAPLFMVCFALIALGATLLVIDGAFALVSGIVLALVPYAPYFIGGVTAFAIAIAVLMAYFRHANKRLAAEYAFRREVMEKTGVILLDTKGRAVLPPGGARDRYAIGSIEDITATSGPLIEAEPVRALPEGGSGSGTGENEKDITPASPPGAPPSAPSS